MTKWSKTVWDSVTPLFDSIVKHPFLTGLSDGTLAKEKFIFYIVQDALYLTEFGRALAGIAVKSTNAVHVDVFLRFALDTMTVEKEMQNSYLKQLDPATFEPTPCCLLYTAYLQRQLSVAPLEVCVATVLPCMWVYKEVGDYILSRTGVPDNHYQSWIDTYGSEEFSEDVRVAVDIADELAAATTEAMRREMTQAFILCSKMEWMFWDSAWRLEKWPV